MQHARVRHRYMLDQVSHTAWWVNFDNMSISKSMARGAFRGLQNLAANGRRQTGINLIAPDASAQQIEEIKRRAAFYFSPVQATSLAIHPAFTRALALDASPVLLFGAADTRQHPLAKLHGGVFDIDWRANPSDGWAWIDAAAWSASHVPEIAASMRRLDQLRSRIQTEGLPRCYLFGTGPSLGAALRRDWSDGIRIVCNTIVRDAELWHHIRPHALVAGDGIYHFGFTEFARAFRRDLRARLKESPSVLFIYPAAFDHIVRRDFGGLDGQLVPLPAGTRSSVHDCFEARFELPGLGNVLNMLLLPLGCALSKRVGLWGFDGRAPDDRLFWANSNSHSYTELLPTLQAAHPAFFDHHVPKDDPEKYLRSVHGDMLEHVLEQAEQSGWQFEMLHPTWTKTLARRAACGVASEP